jgi:hypothetical protein
MGFDYYIIKKLGITFENDDYKTIEIKREGRWLELNDDSDTDIDYKKELEVTYIPKTLYNNGEWKSSHIKEKYDIYAKEGVVKIVKFEVRFLR